MNSRMLGLLVSAVPSILHAQDLDPTSVWEAKLPPFALTKPVVRTNTLWQAQRGQIWIGFTTYLDDAGPVFTGIGATIAGTTESWAGEMYYTHVGEYVTRSGQTYWFPMSAAKRICTGLVPVAEPPSVVRLYSGDGRLLKTFLPEQGAVVPGWEPSLGSGAVMTFRQTKGGAPDTWKTNTTVAAYIRVSADGGSTWVPFGGWIDPDNPSHSFPGTFLGKPEILVDVFSTFGFNFEITRYRLTPGTPGGSPVIVPLAKKSLAPSPSKK